MLICETITYQDSNGDGGTYTQSQHYIFTQMQCWSGVHIIHAVFAIVAAVTVIVVTLVITRLFYKSLYSATDVSAKYDSDSDMQRQLQKTVVVLAFSFLQNQNQPSLVLLLFVTSAFSFARFFYLRSYYNESIQRLQNTLRVLSLWANISLLISLLLQNTEFSGGFQIFFLGLPIAGAIVIISRDIRSDELLKKQSDFQKGEDISRQIRYLLLIITKKDNGDRNSEILLRGFIYNHEEQCTNQQCQLKLFKKNVTNSILGKQKHSKFASTINQHILSSQKSDNQAVLLQHVRNMFRIGIQRFPNSSHLRISYALFLYERLNKKPESAQELSIASSLQPTLGEQFAIFRYQKLQDEYTEEMGTGSSAQKAGQSLQLGQSNQQSAVEMMTRFAFESTYRNLQGQIERCAQYHMEFWSYLKDDRPDLGKLGDCGSRINASIVNVEQIWVELQKLNSNIPKALKLYGRFLQEILHDKETASEYLARVKDLANMKQTYVVGFDSTNDIKQISNDGTPCIMVSGEAEKMGTITQINSGAVSIFGQQSFEMRNMKVEKLMPDLYGRHHSKVLEEALVKGPENIPNKERLVFAKHKSGYIFPVWLQLKLIQNINSDIQFIALFKIDKKIMSSNIGFLLVNRENKIQGISSSCIKLIGLDTNKLKRISNAGYDLTRLAPELDVKRDEIMQTKNGAIVDWIIPFFAKKKWLKKSELDRLTTIRKMKNETNMAEKRGGGLDNHNGLMLKAPTEITQSVTKRRFKFTCQLQPLSMGSIGEIGFYVRIDFIKPEVKNLPIQENKKQVVKQPLFQFRVDFYSGRFIREIRDGVNVLANKNPFFFEDDLNKQSTVESSGPSYEKQIHDVKKSLIIQDNEGGASYDQELKGEKEIDDGNDLNTNGVQGSAKNTETGIMGEQTASSYYEDIYKRKKRWAKDILIYSLRDGHVQLKDYVDEEKKERELEEQRRKKLEELEKNQQELANFTNNIKSKKALKIALNDTKVPPAIRNLRFTMNIVLACLVALAIAEYVTISSQFQEINDNFTMIQRSYRIVSETQRIAYNSRSLILINEGILTNFSNYISPTVNYSSYLLTDIQTALNSVYNLQNEISLSTLSLSDDHQTLVSSKVVPLYFQEGDQQYQIINFTLTESVLQMASAVFSIMHMATNQFTETQEDVFFVMYNAFNDFLSAMLQASSYYQQELQTRADQKKSYLLILFLCSLGTITLAIPILLPAVNSVSKAKDKVLALFIDMPNNCVEELGDKCEKFLGSFHSDQQDDIKSQEDTGAKEEDEAYTGSNTKRNIQKQAKNSSNTSVRFFSQFGAAVLLVLAYFVAMYIIASQYISNIEIVTQEMGEAAYIEAHFSFLQNAQREMLYNNNTPLLNQNSFNVSRDSLTDIYAQVQQYLILHQGNRNILQSSYLSTFIGIMESDLCQSTYIDQTLLPTTDCSTLFNDGPIHGLENVIIMYFEILRENLNTYQNTTLKYQAYQHATQRASHRILAATNTTGNSSSSAKTNATTSMTNSSTINNTTKSQNVTTVNANSTNATKSNQNSTAGNNTTAVKNGTLTNSTQNIANGSSPNSTVKNGTNATNSTNGTSSSQNVSYSFNNTNTTTVLTTTNTTAQQNSSQANQTLPIPPLPITLLNSHSFALLYQMQFLFIQGPFRVLVDDLQSSTNDSFATILNTKMAAFIVFIVVVVLSYLIMWTPFVSNLSRDIWRTKMMITIIPIHIILKIPKIQEFLNKQTILPGGGAGSISAEQTNAAKMETADHAS